MTPQYRKRFHVENAGRKFCYDEDWHPAPENEMYVCAIAYFSSILTLDFIAGACQPLKPIVFFTKYWTQFHQTH